MTPAQHVKLIAKAAAVPVLLLLIYLAVLRAYHAPHPGPEAPRRAPITSITPTDPMAR